MYCQITEKVEVTISLAESIIDGDEATADARVTLEFDPNDYIDEADSDSLINELSERGYETTENMDDDDYIIGCISQNSKIDVRNLSLITKQNFETLIEKLHVIDHFELETFLNRY